MTDWHSLAGTGVIENITAGIGGLIEVRYPWSTTAMTTLMQVEGVWCAGTAATAPPGLYWAPINAAGGRLAVGPDEETAACAYGQRFSPSGARVGGAVLIGHMAVEGAEYRWWLGGPS